MKAGQLARDLAYGSDKSILPAPFAERSRVIFRGAADVPVLPFEQTNSDSSVSLRHSLTLADIRDQPGAVPRAFREWPVSKWRVACFGQYPHGNTLYSPFGDGALQQWTSALATLCGDDGRGDDVFCDGRCDGDDPHGAHSNRVGPRDCRLVPKKAKRRERSRRMQVSGT